MAAMEGRRRPGELRARRRTGRRDRFRSESVDEAKLYVDDFPLSKAGILEWFYIPVSAPLPLEYLFDERIDVSEPFDRTKRGSGNRQ